MPPVPLIAFEAAASAPILRYDVPTPSSYEGRHFVEITLDMPPDSFTEEAKKKPGLVDFLDANQQEIEEYLSRVPKTELDSMLRGVDLYILKPGNGPSLPGGLLDPRGLTDIRNIVRIAREKAKEEDTLEARYELFRSRLEIALLENRYPTFYRTQGGRLRLRFVNIPAEPEPKLLFIETYRLTTYTGDYGAGTTVKTFSLLPGEETEISIKTWKQTTQTMKEASSVLDSYTEDKADEFETSIQEETSNRSKRDESFSYHAEAEAKAGWGWGSAKVSGGVSGASNSSREEMSKNVMNATEKHAQTASAKREVNVDTSYERSEEERHETATMRRIKNLNASRTLNFVFRQMNQEFHSILHLRDLRVAFYNGYPGSMKEFALYELGDLVVSFMKAQVTPAGGAGPVNTVEYLRGLILAEYGDGRVYDYQGDPQQLAETKAIPGASPGSGEYEYSRVIPPRIETDPSTGDEKQVGRQKYVLRRARRDAAGDVIEPEDVRYVDGVILSARKITMRTEGVIVEALLGQAEALDGYALGTQQEVLHERKLMNERSKVAIDVVEALKADGRLEEAAAAYQKMFMREAKGE